MWSAGFFCNFFSATDLQVIITDREEPTLGLWPMAPTSTSCTPLEMPLCVSCQPLARRAKSGTSSFWKVDQRTTHNWMLSQCPMGTKRSGSMANESSIMWHNGYLELA
ncbi:hypothetical protein Nepgr_006406 [Nepenthes gracilis]|uniref:Uncharacterized protein n=1 Tax=Nepenthes gracilis TaxID=150966 RepID=A0AAD3S5H8_NEPGR|nr:hypothetical protein Nepgr_006406 [Nepenthes gracilis]